VYIKCEPPSTNLLRFNGKLVIEGEEYPISLKQMLWRVRFSLTFLKFEGCELKNIDWIYGVSIYTGMDTKLRRNAEYVS
jgi:hypothetical protein